MRQSSADDPTIKLRDGRLFIDAIERCFVVLEAFDAQRSAMTIAQLSSRTGLGRSVTQRIVYSLEHIGYLAQEGQSKRYRLTPRSLGIGARYVAGDGLIGFAQPFLRDIALRFNETVSLTRLDRGDIVVVATIPSSQVISAFAPAGSRIPAARTASGWVLAAGMAASDRSSFIDQVLCRERRDATPEASQRLQLELAKIRCQGFTVFEPPQFAGGLAIAAPVPFVGRHAGAALAVSCPAARWSPQMARERIAPVLMHAAEELARHGNRSER